MKGRMVFIDVFRGWAALVMIEVHVFNAFLLPEIKETSWFTVVNFVNGLVAPSFLFVAGFVFVVVSSRKLEEFRTYGKAFWKQLQRIGLIWFIGYGLHLPFFSYRRILTDTTEAGWLRFYQSDILHCIAVGLVIIFLGRVWIRKDSVYHWFLLIAASVVTFIAPFLREIDFNRFLHPAIGAYLNDQHYSQFPVFPWLGFLLFGGYFASLFSGARQRGKEPEFFARLAFLSLGFFAVGSILIELPIRFPSFVSTAIRSNPLFLFERLGIVLLFMVIAWYYVDRRKTERSVVADAGKETLFVYTAHLMVIYGQFIGDRSLASIYGRSMGVPEASMWTVVLVAAMIAGAVGWNMIKAKSVRASRLIAYSSLAVVVALFFLRAH